jgi:hypothetical protein
MAAKVEVCDAWWGLGIGLNGEGNLGRANLGHPSSDPSGLLAEPVRHPRLMPIAF